MKLSLQLILETLTEYGAQLIETDGDFAFTGVQILTSPTDILEPDTLYVCTPKVLPKLKKQLFENHCFVFKAKPSQLQCHHALHGILLDENMTSTRSSTGSLLSLHSFTPLSLPSRRPLSNGAATSRFLRSPKRRSRTV